MQLPPEIARRTFLNRSGVSVGAMALANLMAGKSRGEDASKRMSSGATAATGSIQPLHFPAKAKRIIWLYMAGGMSHLDTFDYKPKLAAMAGQPMPESVTKGQQIAQLQGQQLKCFAPQHPFKRYGNSGQEICTIWPELGSRCADDMCIVRSMFTEAINHDPAHTFMNTGSMNAGPTSDGFLVAIRLGERV